MKTSLKHDLLTLVFWLMITFLVVIIGKTVTHAQTSYIPYIGMELGVGGRSFEIESDIPQIDNLTTIKSGGSLGMVFGSEAIKVPVVAGLYFQSIEALQSIDLLSLQANIDVSWLRLLGVRSPIEVYSITGFSFQHFSFMGTYLDRSEYENVRYVLGEPLLGRQDILNATVGLGIEYRLLDNYDFIHFFIESQKVIPLNTSSSNHFTNTIITNTSSFNVGVRVGRKR